MRRLRDFRIRLLGRELIEYREGEAAYVFDTSWGVSPLVLYVPRAEIWDRVMPEPFRGRREEIVDRLGRSRIVRGHVFEDSDN